MSEYGGHGLGRLYGHTPGQRNLEEHIRNWNHEHFKKKYNWCWCDPPDPIEYTILGVTSDK